MNEDRFESDVSHSTTQDRYDVSVIFRGLFLSKLTDSGLSVLLPDGREPSSLYSDLSAPVPEVNLNTLDPKKPDELKLIRDILHRQIGPYREHLGVVEFRLRDWRNPTLDLPSLVHLHKPTKKKRVALYFLGGDNQTEEIRFDPLRRPTMSASHFPVHSNLSPDPKKSTTTGTIRSQVSAPHNLPSFGDVPVEEAWRHCVAFAHFNVGEVQHGRLSRKQDGQPYSWELRTAGNVTESSATKDDIHFHLDLIVRFSLPIEDSLSIETMRIPRGGYGKRNDDLYFLPPTTTNRTERFILRPERPEDGLEIWVKNRELFQIILDSDLDPDPYRNCGRTLGLDRDSGLLIQLASDPRKVLIPHSRETDASHCGNACGGCSDP